MKKLILITSQFPYGNGEQFLETEIKYYHGIEVVIMPITISGEKRTIPNNIIIDRFLADNSIKKNKIICILNSFRKTLFYKELFFENFFKIKKLKILLSSLCRYEIYYENFNNYFSKVQDLENTIVYTYWHDEVTYALQSLKNRYNYRLISRIHRGDLYKERRPFDYIPLKKQFTKNIDTLYTITESANRYLKDTYGFSEDKLKLSRLGVDDRNIITKCSEENSLYIVSCSFLSDVKRVDKIIKSLKMIAIQMKDINFRWTHIGDGLLYNQIVSQTKEALDILPNVNYSFVGNYKNEKVYEFYLKNEIDVFINVSESEGVPVSIMEAMSCHIPIIAPDVGGVKDMVEGGYNGFLLSENCTIKEIVVSLSNIKFFKNEKIRENSYRVFQEKYNADKNYKEFVQTL